MQDPPYSPRCSDVIDDDLPLEALQHPRLVGLYRYWDGKRGGRSMPARADLSPEEMGAFLGYVSLIDVEQTPRRFHFRLLGTAIVDAYGRDLSRRYTDDVTPDSYRAMMVRHFAQATDQRRPQLHRLQFSEGAERVHRLIRLTLPLADDEATVNMLLLASIFGDDLPPGERLSA